MFKKKPPDCKPTPHKAGCYHLPQCHRPVVPTSRDPLPKDTCFSRGLSTCGPILSFGEQQRSPPKEITILLQKSIGWKIDVGIASVGFAGWENSKFSHYFPFYPNSWQSMITIDRGVPILPERSYSTTVSEAEPPINKLPGLKLYHIYRCMYT